MPTIFSAQDIAEQALQKVGRFPTTQAAADTKDMARALSMLETILQDFFGTASVTSAQGTLQIPLTAGTLKYPLVTYATADGVQFVFGAQLVNVANGGWRVIDKDIKIIGEESFYERDLQCTGHPHWICIDKGVKGEPPLLQVNPILGPEVPDNTFVLLMQVQTFAPTVVTRGIGSSPSKFFMRPTYYLWAITKLTYQLGTGTVRRLPDGELDRFQKDYMMMEAKLTGFDAPENSNEPFTQPWGQDV